MNNEPTIMLDRLVASIRRGDATLAEAGAYDLVRAWEVAEQRITKLEAEVERLRDYSQEPLRMARRIEELVTADFEKDREVERLRALLRRVQRRSDQGPQDPTHGDDLWDRVAAEAAKEEA